MSELALFDLDAALAEAEAHTIAEWLRQYAEGARAEGELEVVVNLPGKPHGDAVLRAAVELLADPHVRIKEEDNDGEG